jgi:CheY-like chemotaxis protein
MHYSPRFEGLLEYQDHEMQNHFQSYESVLHPEDHDRVMEAIQMINQLPYDVVLMDCQMPGMDGYDATAAIAVKNSKPRTAKISLITMTANAMQGDREHCLAAGMDDYVSMPIKPATVRAALQRWLSTNTPQAA